MTILKANFINAISTSECCCFCFSEVKALSALPFQGGVVLRTFDPDSAFGTYAMLTAICGQFNLSHMRLSLVNEMHTNSCTSPRLENTRFDGLVSRCPKGR